ncbi:MAG: hypothetical protein KGL39_57975 [Patescibacteria group bacterium]|nr:hypothetical protein [Patescibacteria group bacterium]
MARNKKQTPEDEPMVRINVILPLSVREQFNQACQFNGKVKQSMNWRITELLRADIEGRISVPRTSPPAKGWAAKKLGKQ